MTTPKFHTKTPIHIFPGSGKTIGICSIDVAISKNPFCREMSKIKAHVCYKCYRQKVRGGKRMQAKLIENYDLLSETLLDDADIPVIYQDVCIINRVGDLVNRTHLENIIQIAKKNPHCVFMLSTKRIDIVSPIRSFMPGNIRVIYSNIFEDTPISTKRAGFDGVHNIITPMFVATHPTITINCTTKCRLCMRCFKPNSDIINELVS